MFIQKVKPGPGQESVWDYPRPPRLESCSKSLKISVGGQVLAATVNSKRVLETSHPPVYYLPPEDVDKTLLRATPRTSFCEWKGEAIYFDIVLGERVIPSACWSYPSPVAQFAALQDHFAFYPQFMDSCTVNDEEVQPQPGGFYGGWITKDVVGPFKGVPGSMGW